MLENSAIGTTVGITAQASDPDGTDSVTYSLDDNAGGRFTINSTTGVVTVAGSLDRETAATYNITVRATSTDSSSTTQVYTISLGDVDEFDVGSVSDTMQLPTQSTKTLPSAPQLVLPLQRRMLTQRPTASLTRL